MKIKVQKLNLNKLTDLIIRLPLASLQGHHKKVCDTVKDYVLPNEDQLEMEFTKDLFILNTDEIIDKWFDGKENAYDLLKTG